MTNESSLLLERIYTVCRFWRKLLHDVANRVAFLRWIPSVMKHTQRIKKAWICIKIDRNDGNDYAKIVLGTIPYGSQDILRFVTSIYISIKNNLERNNVLRREKGRGKKKKVLRDSRHRWFTALLGPLAASAPPSCRLLGNYAVGLAFDTGDASRVIRLPLTFGLSLVTMLNYCLYTPSKYQIQL